MYLIHQYTLGCPEKQQVAQNNWLSYMCVNMYIKRHQQFFGDKHFSQWYCRVECRVGQMGSFLSSSTKLFIFTICLLYTWFTSMRERFLVPGLLHIYIGRSPYICVPNRVPTIYFIFTFFLYLLGSLLKKLKFEHKIKKNNKNIIQKIFQIFISLRLI